MALTATGSLRQIIYKKEATFKAADTLKTGAKILRNTGDSLNMTKTTSQSEELNSDRSIRFMRHGNQSVAGDISAELAYGAFDELIAGAMCSAWVGDELKPGLIPPTFSFEKGFVDIGQYIDYVGCAVNSLSVSIATDSIITATFGIVGAGTNGFEPATRATTATSDFADTAPFVSFDGELTIGKTEGEAEGEAGKGCGFVTGIDFTIDNGITANYTLCSDVAQSITPDKFNVSGTVTMLFDKESLVELDKFVNETNSNLTVTLEDHETGNTLVFEFPNIKYTGGDLSVSGGGVIPISLPFQALYDETAKTTLKVSRRTNTP